MLVLGLDTSSPAVSAALVELSAGSSRVLGESVVVDARRHGELLALGVREVLDGRSPADLDAVVVGLGPGPFTGLRVGLVTAAGLGDALGVPAYGVCSLDGVPRPQTAGDLVVVADARRREVYWARYDRTGARVDGPHVDRPADLAAHLLGGPLPEGGGGAAAVVGAGAQLHRDAFAGLEVLDGPGHPSVPGLVEAAAARVLAREPADALTPLYLRRPDAVEPGAGKRVTAGGRA